MRPGDSLYPFADGGRLTARTKILQRLALADLPLPIHALDIPGVSQTSASARLREMAREGLVVKYPVKGKHFDAWALTPESDIDFSKPYWAGEK